MFKNTDTASVMTIHLEMMGSPTRADQAYKKESSMTSVEGIRMGLLDDRDGVEDNVEEDEEEEDSAVDSC